MKVIYAAEFRKQFLRLPKDIQRLYHPKAVMFQENWRDPRLHTKKLTDHPYPFSFRITRGYRVLFSFVDQGTALFGTVGHRKDVYR